MNKEMLLQSLKNLQSHLPQTGVDDVAIDEQVEEIEQLAEVRRKTEEDIARLQVKLKDDKNYPNVPVLYNEGLRFNLEDEISAADKALLTNQAEISTIEADISKYESELSHVSKEVNNNERLILDLGRELRRNSNPTYEQEQDYQTKLSSLRSALSLYRNRETELSALLGMKKSDLTNLQSRNKELTERVSKTQDDLTKFDERVKSENDIDIVAKSKDEKRVIELQGLLKTCDMRDMFLSYDFARKISFTIDNLENDTISIEDALKDLTKFKEHLPVSFLDRTKEEQAKEIAELDSTSNNLSEEIAHLQTKLSDEVNYTPSIFAAERNNDQLIEVRNNVASAENDIKYSDAIIAGYTFDITKLDREMTFSNQYILGLQEEIALWSSELRKTQDEIEANELIAKIGINREEVELEQKSIANLVREQETIKNLIKMVEDRKKISKAKKDRYEVLEQNLSNSLSDRNSVDKYTLRMDQTRLSQLESTRNAIYSRKDYLSYDLKTEIDNILNGNMVAEEVIEVEDNQVLEETPVVEATNEEKAETIVNDNRGTFVPYTTSIKEVDGKEVIGEIRDENGKKTGDLVVNNGEYFKKDKEEKTTALIPYENKSAKVVSFSPANEQLNKNIKNKKIFDRIKEWLKALVKDWKKNWKKYVSVTLAAMALGLVVKSCGTPNPNQYADDNSYSTSDEAVIEDNSVNVEDSSKTDENEKNETSKKDKVNSNFVPSGSTIDSTIITSDSVPNDTVGGITSATDEIISDTGSITPELPPIHEGPVDSNAGGGHEPGWTEETITGGGQQGETVEEEVTTPTPTPEQKPEVTPNPGGGETTDEVVDDDIVLPDLGGGEIVGNSSFSVNLDQENNEVYNAETKSGQVGVDASGNVSGDANAVSDISVEDGQTKVTLDSSSVTENAPTNDDLSEYDFNEIMKQLLGEELEPTEEQSHTRGGM